MTHSDEETTPRVSALVVDLEVKGEFNENDLIFPATPFDPRNEIVAMSMQRLAYSRTHGFVITSQQTEYGASSATRPRLTHRLAVQNKYPASFFVGHNVLFDLEHLRQGNTPDITEPFAKVLSDLHEGTTILWDTMYAEYLLSGQSTKSISLDALAKKYGLGEGKTLDLGEMLAAGTKIEDIHPDVLCDYVERDVDLTSTIFKKQIRQAYEEGMMAFIVSQMRSLYVTGEYVHNGLAVDSVKLSVLRKDLEREIRELEDSLEQTIKNFVNDNGSRHETLPRSVTDEEFPYTKSTVLRALIFGGPLEYTVKVKAGHYKTGAKAGEVKYKNEKRQVIVRGYVPETDIQFGWLTDSAKERAKGAPSISTFCVKEAVSLRADSLEQILAYLRDRLGAGHPLLGMVQLQEILTQVLQVRKLTKIDGTFLTGIEKASVLDSRVHCNYNTCITPSGRLTSSSPNLQNIPSGEGDVVKELFRSRFDHGKIATVDFKQLEIVCLAALTNDARLLNHLCSGQDIHYEVGKRAFNWTDPVQMSPDARREIKRVNFGTVYGAGAATLASQGNLTEPQIQRVIKALRTVYPQAYGEGTVEFARRQLITDAVPIGRDDNGLSKRGGTFTQPTGRKIYVEEVPSKWTRTMEWPYTCLKNYPVQSLAYDIVSVARIAFFDEIRRLGLGAEILMVNEVHDEIVFDVASTVSFEVFESVVNNVSKRLPQILKNMYGFDIEDLPLVLEIGWGNNWKEAK